MDCAVRLYSDMSLARGKLGCVDRQCPSVREFLKLLVKNLDYVGVPSLSVDHNCVLSADVYVPAHGNWRSLDSASTLGVH
ncbi:hypothetical protein [Haloferula luteola]|uniref:hypothetical protein n=1 Tax=Haloferula luteola TaxID=595692 RepID=UPI001C85623B|nr:hypothetical protein [Haloferula luteola]